MYHLPCGGQPVRVLTSHQYFFTVYGLFISVSHCIRALNCTAWGVLPCVLVLVSVTFASVGGLSSWDTSQTLFSARALVKVATRAFPFQRCFLLGLEPIRTHIPFLGTFSFSWDQTWRRDAGEGREVHACVRSVCHTKYACGIKTLKCDNFRVKHLFSIPFAPLRSL
jgi:hypothetical protein